MGSGSPLEDGGDISLFLNFCGGGMVSTRPGRWVSGNPLALALVLLGPCAGETLKIL